MQITANHLICTLLFFMLFGTLICNDLRLICNGKRASSKLKLRTMQSQSLI